MELEIKFEDAMRIFKTHSNINELTNKYYILINRYNNSNDINKEKKIKYIQGAYDLLKNKYKKIDNNNSHIQTAAYMRTITSNLYDNKIYVDEEIIKNGKLKKNKYTIDKKYLNNKYLYYIK